MNDFATSSGVIAERKLLSSPHIRHSPPPLAPLVVLFPAPVHSMYFNMLTLTKRYIYARGLDRN